MEEMIKNNLEEWLQNPHWAKYYNEAPTEECKAYIALEFYASETEDEDIFEEMDQLLPELSAADLRHLIAYADGHEKAELERRLNELT